MNEARVDNGVGSARAFAQTVEVVERTALHSSSRRHKGRCSRIRAGQPEHLMTCADQFWNDCGANETGSPSNKDTHLPLLSLTAPVDVPSRI
jgi:hypothetical protein